MQKRNRWWRGTVSWMGAASYMLVITVTSRGQCAVSHYGDDYMSSSWVSTGTATREELARVLGDLLDPAHDDEFSIAFVDGKIRQVITLHPEDRPRESLALFLRGSDRLLVAGLVFRALLRLVSTSS